jgi:hypothetical protein
MPHFFNSQSVGQAIVKVALIQWMSHILLKRYTIYTLVGEIGAKAQHNQPASSTKLKPTRKTRLSSAGKGVPPEMIALPVQHLVGDRSTNVSMRILASHKQQ